MSYTGTFDHAAAMRAAQALLDALRRHRLNSALLGLIGSDGAHAEIAHASLGLMMRERDLVKFCRDCHRPDSLLNIKSAEDRALVLEAGSNQKHDSAPIFETRRLASLGPREAFG
jgi:hypothetical protein